MTKGFCFKMWGAAFALALSVFSVFAHAEVVEKIVATVNSEIITESDLKVFASKLSKSSFLDDLLLQGKSQADLKSSRNDQLEYMINEKILDSEVKRLNLAVTMDRVEKEIRDIAKRNNMNKDQLLEALKGQGVQVSEYQSFMRSKIERQSLIEQEITSKLRVSDEDVMAQYGRNHPNSNTGIFEYTIAHILFNPKKGSADLALDRARVVLGKLKAGESFEVLAEQHSEDPNFTPGGVLGTFKAGEFAKEMEKAVASLSPGETSDVVTSKSGLHILKLVSKKIVADPRFEKEKESIRGQLFEASFQKQFKLWLSSKRDDSFIRINK
jgi:peptidyl-prolyl cis-trans isomerase SurA